ncbi:hypothetical protein FE257_012117 [Aspergillus nanangensis]|uniref:Uncharacterized protein n=1 Tax=Aspergillus nanangensis TaxID=2582783 RepID=A0AAD4GR12_ASPNN|nr:hypothetical protein FE257_012117 [Aspergillus nanangensis]
MSSTQPPYYASTFGDATQHPNASAPIGTQMGGMNSTGDAQTGPAFNTAGPHLSDTANKLDSDSGARQTYTDTPNQPSYGEYHHAGATGRYNAQAQNQFDGSGTENAGSGYASSGVQYQETQPSNSTIGSHPATKGEGIGHGIKSVIAGIHGTGESLRGNLNAAFDKTFGDEEGAAKNAAIARRGEEEIASGEFQRAHHHR